MLEEEGTSFSYIVSCNSDACPTLTWVTDESFHYSNNVGYGPNGEEIFICKAKLISKANGRQFYIPGYKSETDKCCKIISRSELYCGKDYKMLLERVF